MENTDTVKNLVSIIIPVYNTEAYLGYCLNSVVSQTYRQIEVILVNDGSTDDSLTICHNYANIDNRISIISIENSGVSNARNVGLEAAKGEFVQFVDSDDVMRTDMVERFVQYMEVYQVDMAICGFEKIELGGESNDMNRCILSSSIMVQNVYLLNSIFLREWDLSYGEHQRWKMSLTKCFGEAF